MHCITNKFLFFLSKLQAEMQTPVSKQFIITVLFLKIPEVLSFQFCNGVSKTVKKEANSMAEDVHAPFCHLGISKQEDTADTETQKFKH